MADRVNALIATAMAPLVESIRRMSPLDTDTAVGAIFVVCAVCVQIGLVVLVLSLARAVAEEKPRVGTDANTASSAPTRPSPIAVDGAQEPSVEAEVSGFAWMRAAGITPQDVAYVKRRPFEKPKSPEDGSSLPRSVAPVVPAPQPRHSDASDDPRVP
jgi:hypothetical protein